MNAEQKKRAIELFSEWNTHYPEYVGDRMAALLQELTDAPEPVPVAWLPGGFRIEHFAKDDPILTDEANAERRFFVTRIEPPYHKDGVWFGATAEDALAKACAAIGVDYANAPPAPSAPDGLPLLISGAIYDFAGFLTTQEKTIQVGARVDASAVVDMLKEWAALRGLKLDDAAVLSWQEWLSPTPPEPPAEVKGQS